MNLGIVAGEASGDLLGAGLIQALKNHEPYLHSIGVAGPSMLAAGCQSLYEIERLSVMGLIEPLFHLADLFKIRRGLYQYFLQNKPNVFVGIDSPDFNLGLELKLRKAHIPIVHYVSPSVWAWRRKRIFKIAKTVDLMLTLFPFEADFYKQHRVPVCYVGHPLADQIPMLPDKLAARKKLNLDSKKIYIAILPGSRRNEIKHLAKLFLLTARQCWQARPEIEFISSTANSLRHQEIQQICQTLTPDLPIKFYERSSHDVLAAADVVLVASGTATLETMLFKRPMVIAYRTNTMTFEIAKRLIKLSYIGLPNLLTPEKLVPELIQDDATPEALTDALLDYLDHPEKIEKLEKTFTELHHNLRCNANERAAEAIIQLKTR